MEELAKLKIVRKTTAKMVRFWTVKTDTEKIKESSSKM